MSEKDTISKSTSLQTRRYWRSIEEKSQPAPELWETPEFELSPNEMREIAQKRGFSRKDFLKFMGAGAVMLSAACRRPTEHIVPAVIQPAEYLPGTPVYYASSAPDGTGLLVKTREGRPVHIAGNAEHPLTLGGVSASVSASLMDLYDPDRCRKPRRIEAGRPRIANEDDLVSEAKTKIGEGDYLLLTGPVESPSSRRLVASFLATNPGGRHIEIRQDPTLRQVRRGQEVSYGNPVVPVWRLDRADYVLSIDGDFQGSMIAPMFYSAQFGLKRDLRNGETSINRLVVFESMFTVTGSNADERHPIRPGDQTAIALAIASDLVLAKGRSNFAGNPQVTSLLQNYTADKVAPLGVEPAVISRIADELWAHQGNSVVLGGSPLAANGNEASLQVAINLLNSILGNDGRTVDYTSPLRLSPGNSDSELTALIEEMRSGQIKTVILGNGANPLYHLPTALNVEEALGNVDYILSLNDRIDESSSKGHAILPCSHYLESWGDGEIVANYYTLRQPVIRPLYETKSFEDRLIQISNGWLGFTSFHDFLRNEWQTLHTASGIGGTFRRFWQSALQAGYFAPSRQLREGNQPARGFQNGAIELLPRSVEGAGTKLGLYYNIQVLDGEGANNSYRQELPEPITKVTWDNCISILPETARKMRLKQGTIITLKTPGGEITLPLQLQPGLHPDAVVVGLGYGRTAAGRVGNNIGVNAISIATSGSDSFVLSAIPAELKSGGRRKKLATAQVIYRTGRNTEQKAPFAPEALPGAVYDASGQYERPMILEATLEEYNKADSQFFQDKLIWYPKDVHVHDAWEYNEMRWNMVVDLNLCTGCAACVTSCHLENNVPMVGPKEVEYGRDMSWMKIDRYFSGDESSPEVAHQPMLCQHCESAPCENVCPVSATNHSHDGLNVMAYNRCIGTRYCANNCPFKVRRFNWFENWNYMEGLERKLLDPQHLAMNPDVTVRSRGVMEKCTFCIQRIASARHEMRARGEDRLKDGSVKTACQEVCPTKAISFGNINDPKSEVSRLAEDKRAYKLFEYLGINPSVVYLAKIRNKA